MEYLTEQEQIEVLKNWIKQYGLAVVAGIAIALIAVFSWRYWQSYRNQNLIEASMMYDQILTVRAQNKAEDVVSLSQKLLTAHPNSPYGQMAALMLARDAIGKKNYSEAEKQLSWVMDHSDIAALREIARVRLARTLIEDHKAEEALKTLNKIDDKTFVGLIDEVRGDAYVALNNMSAAKEAYQNALKNLPNAEILRPLLQMKHDNLNTQS